MKKHIILVVGLLVGGVAPVYCMETETNELNKSQQKEFRAVLASYRAAYIYQQLLALTEKIENKAELRLRRNLESLLQDYKNLHGNDPFVKQAFHKLDKFKNKEVPAIFQELAKLKTEDL